jgi:hypothetical protein
MVLMKRSALPLVSGRVGPGPRVAQAERLTGLAEEMAAVAGAVVSHDTAHADAVAGEPELCSVAKDIAAMPATLKPCCSR